jgi:hypothetical protein
MLGLTTSCSKPTTMTFIPSLWPEIRVKGRTARFVYVSEEQRQRFFAKHGHGRLKADAERWLDRLRRIRQQESKSK